MTLLQLLKTGAVLRCRPGFRFYAVQHGREISVNQVEAEAAVRAGRVRPESTGPDGFDVYHFSLRNSQ